MNLREAGRGPDAPGRLKAVKGMGWFVDEYNLAQVTVNLTDYKVTPIHVLFEEVKKDAQALNVGVAGSEIVGLVPLASILMAADYYMEKENLFILEEDQKVRLAVERLGLSSVAPFDPKEKIIEYRVAEKPSEPLAGMSLRAFVEEVASRSSAPGGGSVSAAIAAMGAGLGAMAGKLTFGVRKFESVDAQMRKNIPPLHDAAARLIPMIDADTTAFTDFMEALRLPRGTDLERKVRAERMQAGLKKAIDIPLTTMKLGDEAWDALCEVARYANPASRSDVEVGAKALETGIWGAYKNVMINMTDVTDDAFKTRITREARTIVDRAAKKCADVLKHTGRPLIGRRLTGSTAGRGNTGRWSMADALGLLTPADRSGTGAWRGQCAGDCHLCGAIARKPAKESAHRGVEHGHGGPHCHAGRGHGAGQSHPASCGQSLCSGPDSAGRRTVFALQSRP